MAVQLRELREFIARHYSLEELKDLCFDLSVDHEDFSPGKSNMSRELIIVLGREKRLKELLDALDIDPQRVRRAVEHARFALLLVDELLGQLPDGHPAPDVDLVDGTTDSRQRKLDRLAAGLEPNGQRRLLGAEGQARQE